MKQRLLTFSNFIVPVRVDNLVSLDVAVIPMKCVAHKLCCHQTQLAFMQGDGSIVSSMST